MKLYRNCDPSRVLQLLARESEPKSALQIAEAMPLAKQRAIDVLTALSRAGMVTRERTGGRFQYAIAKTGRDYVSNNYTGASHVVEASAGNVASNQHAAEPEPAPEVEPVSPVRSED